MFFWVYESSFRCRCVLHSAGAARQLLLNQMDSAIIAQLHMEMVPVIVFPGDLVLEVGDRSVEMFFVTTGELEVRPLPTKGVV